MTVGEFDDLRTDGGQDELEHLSMLYPYLVDQAMRSQEPVTDIREYGEHRTIYSAAQYDPRTEIVWRADIDADEHPDYDTDPRVKFSKCYPTADQDFIQSWTSLATGSLSGPQKLPAWESLFTVFNAALGLYQRESLDSDKQLVTDGGEDVGRGTSQTLLADDRQGAVISDDGQYRYRLWRTWDATKPTVAFVMLNPSTADDVSDDNTIRRCIGFAKNWGYGTLVVANLFALRTKDPSVLRRHPTPVGPENDEHLQRVCADAETVIVAWGTNGSLLGREQDVARLLDDRDLHALDTTKDGHPAHPLYQPADADLALWRDSDAE